jgi:transglutaminase superfamily protein/coenzyme PQQ synthesis protein D (PqqD)
VTTMQVATSSTPISTHSFTETAQRHKDGSVLLSIADDRICKLNGVGALTWMVLDENPAGLSLEDVVRKLRTQFDAINAEGQLHYEVSPEQLRSDTARFLKKMAEMNLLVIDVDSAGQEFYRINDGVSGTTSMASVFSPQHLSSESTRKEPASPRPLKRETLTAFIALLAFDLLLKFRGFGSLISQVEHWPIAEPRTTNLETCRRIRAMVDRAQMYYPKKAMCLQHSAVVTCLLRRRGVPAEMILAAQHFPAKAHAWVEVAGTVVNENQSVRTKYFRLRQI